MKIIDLAQGAQNVLPGAPFESVHPAAVLALREFCNRSLWYQDEITPTLIDSQAEYSLSVPLGTELVQVIRVVQDASALGVTTKPLEDTPDDIQMWYYNLPGVDLGLVPAPNAESAAVTVTAALRPIVTAINIDDRLSLMDEVISSGALSRLFAEPLSGWYSPQQSDYYRAQFKDGIRKAANDAAAGYVKGLLDLSLEPLA